MNLFICYTPLHVVITKKIINLNPNENNHILFLGNTSNKKNQHYLELLNFSNNTIICNDLTKNLRNGKSLYLSNKIKKIKKLLCKEYDSIYIACYDKKFVNFLLSKIIFKNFYTFDDGIGNLVPDSRFNHFKTPSNFKRFLHFLLGRKYFPSDLAKISKCHYTIFDKNLHTIKKYVKINLLEELDTNYINNKTITIILGTVYEELVEANQTNISYLLLNKVKRLLKNSHTYYIPHPRENIDNIKNNIATKKIINSPKIAEELIIQFAEKGYSINLIGFGSTVQFNLLFIKNITNYILTSSYLSRRIINFYDSLPYIENFNTINLDDDNS